MTLRADEIRLIMSPSEMKVRRGPHREQEKKILFLKLWEKGREKTNKEDGGGEGTSEWRQEKDKKKYLRTPEEEQHLHSSISLPPSFP